MTKRKFSSELFQGTGPYINLSIKMLKSKVGIELLKHSKAYGILSLFLIKYQKGYDFKTNTFPNSNKYNLSLPKSEFEIYMDKRTFYTNIDFLIEHGFIKVINYRFSTRECTIYGFSDNWLKYNTDDFFIPNEDKRPKTQVLNIYRV